MRFSFLKLLVTISFFVILSLFISCGKDKPVAPSSSQSIITFEKTFGGIEGRSVKVTSDSGYIITGITSPSGSNDYDVYLMKTDKDGDFLWGNSFGGSSFDFGYSAYETFDGGYILSGETNSYGAGSNDVYLIKTDKDGNLSWEKAFGTTGMDYGNSVYQASDGSYIVTGSTWPMGGSAYDILLAKVDSYGSLIWIKSFGGASYESGNSICEASDGSYIISGSTYSTGAGAADVYLIKIDTSGNLVWEKTFGGNGYDISFSVQETSDGGFVMAGWTNSNTTDSSDVYLVKTDSSGALIWEKTFGGNGLEHGYSVCETLDGGYIIAGLTTSYGSGGDNVYLVKTDHNGDLIWEKTFGGLKDDRGYSVCVTSDGGYIIAGYTASYSENGTDIYLIKINSEGNVK